MSKKRALAIIATLVVSFSLFSIPLDQIVQEAKQNSTTIKKINLAKSSSEISLTQKDLPKELGISVSGDVVYVGESEIERMGVPVVLPHNISVSPSVSLRFPNDGNTSLSFSAKSITKDLVSDGSWSADPQIGISHTFKFGDSGDALDDLSLSKQRIEIELNYQKQILNFESSIYGKIIELLNLEKTLLNNEKDIYVAKTKVEDSKILKDISFESASFKSLELDLARKESAKNSTLQKIALVQSQYEQLTGHLWQGVEDITKASLKLPSLKGGDSSVILASIDLEYAKEQLEVQKRATVRTQAGLTVPTLTVQGSAGLNYASSSDKVSYSVGTSASYSGKDFGTSASVGLSINDERVVPTVTIGGSWSKNTTGTSDYLTLQNLENRVTLANIDYQQALIDYQMKLNSLASEVLDYEVSLNQFEQIVEITKQNLETTKEAFELGLVTETDLNNALLEVELLKFDKDVLELNGLILENKIKELSL
ncbi:MAG: TolC family protein [Sphaerochaetaceae bacterium]